MLESYSKIAFRNILKTKGYSFINIVGLAIGIAACSLISLWVRYQLSYDKFHVNAGYLYRAVLTIDNPDEQLNMAITPPPLASAILESAPQAVVNTCRVYQANGKVVKYEDNLVNNSEIIFVDSSFFEMFSFPIVTGKTGIPWMNIYSAVISEKMSHTIFGNKDPIGESISIENKIYDISAVAKDAPMNSHLRFDFILPINSSKRLQAMEDNWGICNLYTYVQLSESTALEDGNKIISLLREKNKPGSNGILSLQPISDIHLYHKYEDSLSGHGNIKTVYLISTLALFLLILACVNFINLTTARAATRAAEIGVRKVIGASRINIIRQFYFESIVLTGLSLILAGLIIEISAPLIEEKFGLSPGSFGLQSLDSWLLIIGIAAVVAIISGSYPALYLSSFSPGVTLRINHFTAGGSYWQKTLVIFQFALTIGAISGSSIIAKQLNYIRHKDLGYTCQNIIYAPAGKTVIENIESFRNELKNISGIVDVSCGSMPVNDETSTIRWNWPGKNQDEEIRVHPMFVDYKYIETMKMEMKSGRSFSEMDNMNLGNKYIINETAARIMHLVDPVGKQLTYDGHFGSKIPGEIIGIVKDFHYGTLHNKIGPVVMMVNYDPIRFVCLRVNSEHSSSIIKYIQKIWLEFSPGGPMDYVYLENQIHSYYRDESIFDLIIRLFTFFSILLSGMGLFALVSYSLIRRTKEIGIRKVHGASEFVIVWLLIKDYLELVAISSIVALPVIYFVAIQWLQNYAYRINVDSSVFVSSSLAALLIVAATVSYQAIKAARTNPVETLRYE